MLPKKSEPGFRVLNEVASFKTFKIRPEDFDLSQPLLNTFGKAEIEWAAKKLLVFFQSRGYWFGFTLQEMIIFYNAKGWNPNLAFFGLMGGWYDDATFVGGWVETSDVYIAIGADGTYYVTDKFVEKCYLAVSRKKA